jgi:hypothetical protein
MQNAECRMKQPYNQLAIGELAMPGTKFKFSTGWL